MNNQLETTLSLIGQIYDAALQPEIWPAFAARLCQIIPSTDFNIHAFNTATNKTNVAYRLLPDESLHLYLSKYESLNPYHQRSIHLFQTGVLFRSHQFCPPEEFEQTEFYQDYFRPLNLFHAMNLVVLLEDNLAASVSMARSKGLGIYTDEEAELLQSLLPHLCC